MKRGKRISLIIIGLILVFSLIACSKDSSQEDLNQEVEQTPTDQVEEAEVEDEVSDDDPIDLLIDSSDYISKIKLIQKGQGNEEIKILDNITGNLSTSDLPTIDGLKENKPYLVFLKDDGGNLVLTDEDQGIILLEGDNHELFEKLNKKVHNK